MLQSIKTPQEKEAKNKAIRAFNAYNDSFDPQLTGLDFNQNRIEAMREQYERHSIKFPEIPYEFCDPATLDVMNIPAKLITIFEDPKTHEKTEHAHYFDFSTLVKNYKANKARYDREKIFGIHPLNRLPFQTSSLIPAPEMQDKILGFIQEHKEFLFSEVKKRRVAQKEESKQLELPVDLSESGSDEDLGRDPAPAEKKSPEDIVLSDAVPVLTVAMQSLELNDSDSAHEEAKSIENPSSDSGLVATAPKSPSRRRRHRHCILL